MGEYILGCGVPNRAPVDILYAFAKLSGLNPMASICMSGLQRGGIREMEIREPITEIPYGFAIVWLSLTEKLVYEIDMEFDLEFRSRLFDYFKNGFKNRQGKSATYTHLNISFFPGGNASIHLLSSNRVICTDFFMQGKVSSEYDYGFLREFGPGASEKSMDDYINLYYNSSQKEYFDSTRKFVMEEAMPNKLWKRYYTRYDYCIDFVFEAPDSQLYFWSPKFSNAESFSCQAGINDGIIIKTPAALCSLNLWWQNGQYRYTSYFNFREGEILPLFETAFAENPNQRGVLSLKVGKYNNSFEITLCLGDKNYELLSTEIRVFRDSLSDLKGESELIYMNYEENKNYFPGM